MKLKAKTRLGATKGENKQLRRAGMIPAVIYSRGEAGKMISIEEAEYAAILRHVQPGHLSTTRIDMTCEDGATHAVYVKDIDYHPTTYDVRHIDFLEVFEDVPVTIRVPIEMVGSAECRGVKAGGFLRQIVRGVRVTCVPAKVPAQLDIDVADLGMKQSVKMKKISFPEGVTPKIGLETVVATVAKR